MSISRLVIVGASLAGLRAAEALRAAGFNGRLTLIGDEPYPPYDRPPLSKAVLLGRVPAARTGLPQERDIAAEWLLGVSAAGLDLKSREVLLADGRRVGFDRILITTGTRARQWPDPVAATLDGVCTLRTQDDAARLRARLAAGPRACTSALCSLSAGSSRRSVGAANSTSLTTWPTRCRSR